MRMIELCSDPGEETIKAINEGGKLFFVHKCMGSMVRSSVTDYLVKKLNTPKNSFSHSYVE